jgi:hypothetical protein
MREAEPRAPHRGGKNHRRQQKEDSRDFKPQNPAHAAKWAQKTADPASQSPAGPRRSLCHCHRRSATDVCRHSLRLCNCLIPSGLCTCRQALTGDSSGDAEPDAQGPANGLRSHPVYDGSSVHANPCFGEPAEYGLLTGRVGSKVEGSCAAS